MRSLTCLLTAVVLVTASFTFTGCGPNVQEYSETEVVEVSVKDQIKQLLEPYAETGELDSGAETLVEMVEALKAEGGANADELLTDAKELVGLNSGAKVKSKAAEMIKKLEG